MSDPKVRRQSRGRAQGAKGRRRGRLVLGLVLVLGVAALGAFLWLRAPRSDTSSRGAGQAGSGAEALKGRWIRPDGGYILEIKQIAADGKIEAAYFNPNPIHVSRAEAARDGQVTRMFVELRDTGYPGATYSMAYDPGTQTLKGVYFQPALAQSFDVVFFRMQEEKR